jgi:hypothetical protein
MATGLFTLKQQVLAIREGGWPGQKPLAVDYLVVAGGGGAYVGGGGGGGLLQGNIPVSVGSAITVTVGAGGANNTSPGGNSVFGVITALGGGASAASSFSGGSGAGGNHATTLTGGQGTFGQGNAGGNNTSGTTHGAGGGGAGTPGLNSNASGGGNGGAGIASDISGTRRTYSGGGGGSGSGTQGIGGAGGGGTAYSDATGGPNSGTANTGGGCGGTYAIGGGAGGSGIVILSYPDIYAAAASTTGSPTVSTSGSGSLFFNGGSVLHLGYGAQTPFSFGTGDFTIEFWYYNTSVTTTILADWRAGGTNGAYPTIYISGTSPVYYVSGADRITGNALANSTWYHIAVCRTGTSTKMYVNGTQVGSTYTDSTNYIVNTNGPSIGNPTGVATGYMSNVRIAKGVCVYTGNFTVPTSPLTATQPAGTNISAITGTQTSLLLNTVSGALFADSSTNGYAATVTGSTISWNSLSPFATGLGYKNRVYTWTSSGSITF